MNWEESGRCLGLHNGHYVQEGRNRNVLIVRNKDFVKIWLYSEYLKFNTRSGSGKESEKEW